MASLSLAENFNSYFEIVYADDVSKRTEGYKIRHQVYAEELGWEPTTQAGTETDLFDKYAHSLLLRHKRTGLYAGTVRLVIPPPEKSHLALPFEGHFSDCMYESATRPESLPRGAFGEVSRLAVPQTFRRRAGEKKQPFILNEESSEDVFSGEERSNFPNIAIGLYLSIISFAKICNHEMMYVVVEPRLKKRLERVGLMFEQISEAKDYRGTRALFCLTRSNFESQFNDDMLELYSLLEQQLVRQIKLYPYIIKQPQ
ncbi:PEP-CTERM/exosortase system-associated acyltransferase [Neptunicella marina]|uniref:PEP-CTERM/exosortase system-associated acyltransferase n=1 Tax=Neptunicella marina TaxID=2125989 RepID=A0A8J6M1T2_9ALTE|nr:PEP-CTERM/exosortase system-associated acyltransferase [Neptunicella marina]MBC3765788.1 PEP-CTERM/exosortase system-associated acyltransferase [Neptunicella marina]